MADVPVLVCTEGQVQGQRFAVPEGGLDIGRAPENHLVIEEEGVSRFHAHLLFDNGALWLRDAGSRNGVFVNGTRVTQHQALKIGDELQIAQHRFVVQLEPESQLPPPTPPLEEPSEASRPEGNEDTTQSEEPEPASPKRWFWPFS